MGAPVAYQYRGQPSTSSAALITCSGTPVTFANLVAVNPNPDLAAPAAPATATAATGGTVANGTYQVKVSYVNAAGETLASAASSQVTAGSGASTLTVDSPSAAAGATGWYAYVTQAGGSTFTRQQTAGSPTAIGTNLVLTAPPTSTGANPPAADTSGSPVTLSLSVVRSISGVTEIICNALPVPPASAMSLLTDYELELGEYVLGNGDALYGSAGAADAITVTAF